MASGSSSSSLRTASNGASAMMMLQRELKDLMKKPRSSFFKVEGLSDENIFQWIV